MSKAALIEIGIGAALIATAILLPGGGALLMGAASPLISSLFAAGASMAVGGIFAGASSLLSGSTGGVSGAMRNPIGAHNYQFGLCSVAGTTVYMVSNSNTGGGTTSDDKQLHIVRVLNAHPSAIGEPGEWTLFVGGKPCVMETHGTGYLSVSPTQQQISITSISRSGGLVTLVLSSGLANANGTTVYVKDVEDSTYNCICTVTQPNPADDTTFTYVCGGEDGSSSGGILGTAYEDVGGRVYVEFLNGNHTSTFPTLLNSGTQWGPTDLWLGRTLMYLQLGYDASDFGSVPDIRLVCQGNNMIFDPRTNTYGFSSNSALCIAYYLNLPREDGGFGLQYGTDINTAQLIAAANICDEAIPLAEGGTVPRYTCNGNIQVSRGRGTILQELLSSCAGRISFSGGQYSIFPGAWITPSASFTDADFAGPVEFQVLLSARDIANGAKGVYTSPANNWQEADIPPYLQDTNHGFETNQYLTQDNNESMYLTLNLPFTTDPATAQRLLKIAMMRTRFQFRVTVRLSMKAFVCTPLDVITLTHARYNWSNTTFEVLSADIVNEASSGNPRMYMQLALALTDPSIYEWSSSEELSVTGYVQPDNMGATKTSTQPNDLTLYTGPGETVGGVTYPSTVNTGADGIARNSLYVSWIAPNDVFVTSGGLIEIQYQLVGATSWTSAGHVGGAVTNIFIPGVTDGQQYNVQIRAINAAGAYSAWVTEGPVTISSAYSTLISEGIAPNIPYNITNNATIDSILESGAASIRVYGPGGVGTSWDQYTGQSTITEAAVDITGNAFSTVYYVVLDSSGDYHVFTDYADTLNDSYILVGQCMTVSSGGTGGGTGGGGTGGGGTGGPRTPTTY